MTGTSSCNNNVAPPSPHTIFEHLNGEIVGHYVMKKALSVAIYNHLCNVSLSRCKDSEPTKGPSGGVLALHNSTVVRSSALLSRSFGGLRASPSHPLPSHLASRRGSEAVVVLADSPAAADQYMSPCVARVIIEASSHRLHLRKQNILTFDATGSKKHGSRPLNAIATCIAKFVDVPFVRCDCSVIAPAKKRRKEGADAAEEVKRRRRVRSLRGLLGQLLEGAKRESVEGIVAAALRKANYDVDRAERAIVFLDSMDEIGNSVDMLSDSEDGNEDSDALKQRLSNQIRREILELIEGRSITVTRPSDGSSEKERSYTVNTKNMFFLCFGVNDLVTTAAAAKEGTVNPVERRDSTLSTDTGIASQASENKWRPPTNTANNAGKAADNDSIDSNFHSNSTDDDHADEDSDDDSFTGLRENKMAKLLLETKSSPIPEFQTLWGMKDVQLKITPEALEIIADQAKDQRAGAEGVRAILEKLLLTVKFAIPEDVAVAEVEITEETVLGKAPPIFHFATAKRADNNNVEIGSHGSSSTEGSQTCGRPATCRSEATVCASNKESLMSWLTEFDQDILEVLEI